MVVPPYSIKIVGWFLIIQYEAIFFFKPFLSFHVATEAANPMYCIADKKRKKEKKFYHLPSHRLGTCSIMLIISCQLIIIRIVMLKMNVWPCLFPPSYPELYKPGDRNDLTTVLGRLVRIKLC